MVKRQVTLQVSDLTGEQLRVLQALWGCTQSEVVMVAVDRVCREELARYGLEPGTLLLGDHPPATWTRRRCHEIAEGVP